MSFKTVFAAVFALAAIGTAAARPAEQTFVAKIEQPFTERTRVIAQGSVWHCESDTCTAVVSHAATSRACRQLAREVGRITEYGPAEAKLPAEALATCNTGARTRR